MKLMTHMAKAGANLLKEIASKHEGEHFLPEVSRHPHLHKRTLILLYSYCDLIIEIGDIFKIYKESEVLATIKFKKWLKTLKSNRIAEHKLYYDSFIEIGGE